MLEEEFDRSAQQDLCFESSLTEKKNNKNPINMMTAESRLIALLKPKVHMLLLYWKKKKKKGNTEVHGGKGTILFYRRRIDLF